MLTWDKQDIINLANEIGTYDISKGPEICSLLGPNNPSTKSKVVKIENELTRLDLNKLIKESIAKA